MSLCVAYDITRLVTRMINLTPNGIDRVDDAFARHFVDPEAENRFGIIIAPWGPRVFGAKASRAAIDGIAAHWGEFLEPADDRGFRQVVAELTRPPGQSVAVPPAGAPGPRASAPRVTQGRSGQAKGVLRWCAEFGFPLGRSPVRYLPEKARYINVSQFPLWIPRYFEWLERRPDIKAVFFIHDLLPLDMPEYFRAAEYQRHRRRLENLARFGAAAIVATDAVAAGLSTHLKALGRPDMPIFVAPLPVSAAFCGAAERDPALEGTPFFVICGTIEPRKNHLLLLQVWRELVGRDGAAAPKLVIVGNRGWKYEAVVDLLERSPSLAQHVVEVGGLSTPALKRLLDHARALLMPTFAEGYGLPVREALAAGVPVIASDIPAFRDIAAKNLTLLSPIDGEAWLAAIRRMGAANAPLARTADPLATTAWRTYFEKIDAFVSGI
jgi:glycosyltransferase involved in cell wall biosynthesis